MRVMMLATAAMVTAAPALAQAPDPLAPLPLAQAPAPAAEPAPPVEAPILRLDPPSPILVRPAPVAIQAPRVQAPGPIIVQAPIARPVPAPVIQIPRDWRGVFAAIRSGQWLAAQAGIATLPQSVLTPVAKAELYTAKGSPVVSLAQLQALLAEAPDLPEADQIARMALSRGATQALVVPRNRLVNLGSAPTRTKARAVSGDLYADQLRAQIEPLLEQNLAPEAEALLIQALPYMSYNARAEASQRIAWTYYATGRDMDARRLAESGKLGATGEWATHSAWVSGLAAWRMGDCESASRNFREVAATSYERELRAGGYYWAARAEQACRRPRGVAPLLKAAAASSESFYGLVARETLGMSTRLPTDPNRSSASVEGLPNVRRAEELVRIGERSMAEELLRHQARIGRAQDHRALIEVARRNDLAGAQFWLGHFGPPGAVADASDRYPLPRVTPVRGWRIDPALALAHARQESNFRADAVSPAGAVGLMQVRPGTASDIAVQAGLSYSPRSLTDPTWNIEYGQSFIEKMRRNGATAGQLPRVIAAYNAGPLPVGRWASIYDKGDPLLWIESLTYWETRYYVPAVLRNMWVYQGLLGEQTPALKSMAEHRWPSFPTGGTSLVSRN